MQREAAEAKSSAAPDLVLGYFEPFVVAPEIFLNSTANQTEKPCSGHTSFLFASVCMVGKLALPHHAKKLTEKRPPNIFSKDAVCLASSHCPFVQW